MASSPAGWPFSSEYGPYGVPHTGVPVACRQLSASGPASTTLYPMESMKLGDRLSGQWCSRQRGERLDRLCDHDDVTGRRSLLARRCGRSGPQSRDRVRERFGAA